MNRFAKLRQFSLKTFLLLFAITSVCIAWISQNHRQYSVEQGMIGDLAKRMPPGSLLTVATNGETTYMLGSPFM